MAGEGRPPPLYRVDTEDLINVDPESPDDLIAASKSDTNAGMLHWRIA